MAKWRRNASLLAVGAIATVSAAACSPGGSSRTDGSSSSLDDDTSVSVDADSDSQLANTSAIAIACGDFSSLGVDAPYLDADEQIVVPGSQITVSFSDNGQNRLTFDGSGLTLGENTGIPGGSSVGPGSFELPQGDSTIGLVVGIDELLKPGGVNPDVVIHVSESGSISGLLYSHQEGIAPASVFVYRPNGVPEYGAEVSVALDAGIAQIGLEGNLSDGKGLEIGEPFLPAEPITPDMANGETGKIYTKTLGPEAKVGDVVVVTSSNIPSGVQRGQSLTCASFAVKTSAADVAAR